MKEKKNIWHVGYAVAIVIAIVMYLTDLSRTADVILGVLFAVVFSVSHVRLLHEKMQREDIDYKEAVIDRRNISIKEKSGNIMNIINIFLMGSGTILFLLLDYIVPAVVLSGILVLQPLLLIFVSSRVEKRV